MKLIDYIKKYDRRLIYPQMGNLSLKLTGYKIFDVYNSAEKQLEVAKAMDDTFGGDFVYPLDYGVIFLEALGVPLLKPEYDFPSTLENPIKNLESLDNLKVLDPYKDGNMPLYLESIKKIATNFEKPLALALVGPFTLASELAGVTHLARCTIKNPEFVSKLMQYTTEVVLNFAKAAVDNGVKFLQISEPTTVILSPKRFDELVTNNLRRIFNSLDAFKILHICGDTTYLINQLIKCGAEGLSIDQIIDMPKYVTKLPKDMVIIGNIDPLNVLYEMNEEDVKNETLKILKSMKNFDNFMLAPGCDCLLDTPTENIKAYMEAGKTKLCDL
ncbi:uroporphyrinogen decarboxylase family protein [Haloimpatiens sp. FM7315]|uniref:uroporphyrinogen decarboxylase family protein n=1 Tax=Haloimpatiens sp. FM7315 TaxID=3298609 RepID=UPI0035A2CAED